MNKMKITYELSSKTKEAPLRIRATWGAYEVKENGTKDYFKLRLPVGVSIAPEQLKGGELRFLPANKIAEIEQTKNSIRMNLILAHQRVMEKYEDNNLITRELLKKEYDVLTGNKKREYDLPTDIKECYQEIARRKGLSQLRLTSYDSAYNRLSKWAKEKGVKLDWLHFTNQNYHDFMQALKAEGKSKNTLSGYKKRINVWIKAAKAATIPMQVDLITGEYKQYKAHKRVKVTLNEEQMIEVSNYRINEPTYRFMEERMNWKKIMLIMLSTGCRISDLWKIVDPANHITDENGNLFVDFIAQKKIGDDKRTRVVVPILYNIKAMVLNSPPTKISETKIRSGIHKIMTDIYGTDTYITVEDEKLNIALDCHPHALRGTIYTYLIDQMIIPIHLIQQMLAHKQYFGEGATAAYYSQDKFKQAKALRTLLVDLPFYKEKPSFEI